MNTSSSNEWPSPTRLPKTRPSNPRRSSDSSNNNVMVQSCPTPPQGRRRFFLSPKAIRSPFASRTPRQPSSQDNSAMSGKFLNIFKSYLREIVNKINTFSKY